MKIKILIIVFISGLLNFTDLKAQCKPSVWSFKSGEELYYNVVYNWGFIWVEAGKVNFKAKKEYFKGKQVFHFSGTGFSLKKYDWIFTVRDYYNSYAEISDLKPIKYIRNTSEGKYKTDNTYNFDYKKRKIYTDTENSSKPKSLDTLKLPYCLFDIMTAVFYVRTLDLKSYNIDEKISLKMIIDNEIYNLYGRYLGKETIKTKDKKKYKTLKFSIKLVEGTIFSGGEDLIVWVSDDNNRIPILVEAKILVGSVKASFDYAKNTKYPLLFENTK